MNFLYSERFAASSILFLLGVTNVFHLAVLTGVVPYTIVWGGRLNSHHQMVRFESVSIVINIIMFLLTLIRGGFLKIRLHKRLLSALFFLMTGLFFLNTLGNIFSKNRLEQVIFTPLTMLLAWCSLRLAIGNPKANAAVEKQPAITS